MEQEIQKEAENEPLLTKDDEPIPINYNSPLNFFKVFKLQNPVVEICLFSFLAVYLIVFYFGKVKNEKIAKEWLISTYKIWKENFAELGIDDASTLVRDGNHEFWYYATGRKHCQSVFTRVKLCPRQDIISIVRNFYQPTFDKIVMEVVLNKNESDDFVFALMARKMEAEIKKKRYDLKNFPRRYKGNNAPNPLDYTVLTDAFDFASRFFDNTYVKHALQLSLGELDNPICKRNNPWIESIIITDQPTTEPDIDKILSDEPPLPPNKTLTITARIPSDFDKKNDDMEAVVVELTELVIRIIDFIGEHGKVDNDELSKKKLEQKRARASEIQNMSPEKQRKYEEKLRKQELKKELKKKAKRGKTLNGRKIID
ncbi:DUF1682-domain-containing protein [Neocallimastix californiae]|uniref:DUF1682-domain-containing protein n=1 Tax=Neocallimastix californiae TaxID=1754190 RepID=A0A1Y1ZXM7_9FUNG|nr:DUF1682-domain-containing protein [Neocallimastix californiae]|eukprot:ORY14978.1 DUF1682-domain-containing protein [Neocallimastix californiae]